jgi:hypothetical protein
LADRHQYLWFDDIQKPGVKQYDGGWTEETRDVDGVHVSVLTRDDALRKEILDSAVKIDGLDTYGCETGPLTTTLSGLPMARVGTVKSVEVCEYWGGGVSRTPESPLIAGSRLEGKQAEAVVEALSRRPSAAPQAGETPSPGCTDDGGRTYKLTVHGADGTWQGNFAYSNCYLRPRPQDPAIALIRTGAHKPAQPSDLIDLPSTFTPPER